VAIVVQLLGPPLLMRDGMVYASPRGKKVWALLAYLVLSELPPSRQQLMDLLFPDAEDPASALRWNLSELRRLLGGPETIGSGNTVRLRLLEESVFDVAVLQRGASEAAVGLAGLGRELLEGVNVEASPGFAAWLLGERRRLQALAGAVLREGALRALASGVPDRAVALASRLIGAEPLSEDAHVLLVRAFAAMGDEVAVERQLAASIDLFQRELGVELGPELYAAARMDTDPVPSVPAGRVSLKALIESGEAALGAGAVEAGLDELRHAVVAAKGANDAELEAEALLAFGAALVHSAKGRDEEGSAALHRAIAAAEAVGDRTVTASANRELGYVELLRGDYARSNVWLRNAIELAGDDPLERSRIRAVMGFGLIDVESHDRAEAEIRSAIDLALSVDDRRQEAWATAFLGRSQLLRGDLDAAADTLGHANELTRAERWTAFLPFPEALLAEVWFRQGRGGLAAEGFEHAFALGRTVNDACWEAYGVRGLGLLKAAGGDLEGSITLMEEAATRSARQRDTHLWLRAYVLDGLCAVAIAAKHPEARAWTTELGSLAGRTGMRGLSVRAYLDQRDLGDVSAIDGARTLAIGIENPHLQSLVDPDGPPLLEDLLGRA